MTKGHRKNLVCVGSNIVGGVVQLECKMVMERTLPDITGMEFSTSPMEKKSTPLYVKYVCVFEQLETLNTSEKISKR